MNILKYSLVIALIINALVLSGQVFFIAEDGTGAGNSWANATDLTTALDNAVYGDTLWIKAGIYYPTTCSNCSTAERSISFEIPNGVQLYGGFAGYETNLSERNWQINTTIFSGDIDQDEEPDNNSLTILSIKNVDTLTTLDGIVFSNGNASGASTLTTRASTQGGAIFNDAIGSANQSHPTIRNCTFTDNYAMNSGGAIHNDAFLGGTAKPLIINCLFEDNYADVGAAIYNNGQGGNASPKIFNCIFKDNEAGATGGAIYSVGKENGLSEPKIINCIFNDNKAASAGAVYSLSVQNGLVHTHITNCTFYDNYASVGGAVYVNASNGGSTETTISNSILDNNSAGFDDHFHYSGESAPVIHLSYSIIDADNCDNLLLGSGEIDCGEGIIFDEDPDFIDKYGNNFRLEENSPAINAGNDAMINQYAIDIDLDGLPRIFGAQVDMGAFEYNTDMTLPLVIENQPESQSLCEDMDLTFSVAATGAAPLTYQWQLDGEDLNGEDDNTLDINNLNPSDTGNYSCMITDGFGQTMVSDVAHLIVIENIDPQIELLAYALEVCVGATVQFTAETDDAGDNPTYEWYLNNELVGQNAATFTLENATDEDEVYVVLFSSEQCLDDLDVTSNYQEISTIEYMSAAIEIETQNNEACSGESVDFQANTNNEGDYPSYAWYVDGSLMPGENEANFTLENIANEAEVYCVLTSSEMCLTEHDIASNIENIAIVASVEATITISADTTDLCVGQTLIFTANATNEGENPIYEWYVNGEATNQNDTIFSYSGIQNNDQIWATLQSSKHCISEAEIISNHITIQTANQTPTSLEILANTTNICNSDTLFFTTNSTGGGPNAIYSWFVNNQMVAMGETYEAINLENQDQVSCIMQSSLVCVTNPIAFSDTLDITVGLTSNPTIFITASEAEICPGETAHFFAVTNDAGNNPQLEWFINEETTGETGSTFSTNQLAENDMVQCHLISTAECVDTTLVFSNTVVLPITAQVLVSLDISADQTAFCANTNYETTFTATAQNPGIDPVYTWYVNGVEIPGDGNTCTHSNFAEGDTVHCIIITEHECAVSNQVASEAIELHLLTPPTVELAAFDTICHDIAPFELTQGTPVGGVYNNTFITDNIIYPLDAANTVQTIEYIFTDANGCANTATNMMMINLCTPTEEVSQVIDFQLFPNPASDIVTIISEAKKLEIIDAQGRVLLRQNLEQEAIISLQHLPSGVYWVKVIGEEEIGIQKLMKQ